MSNKRKDLHLIDLEVEAMHADDAEMARILKVLAKKQNVDQNIHTCNVAWLRETCADYKINHTITCNEGKYRFKVCFHD